MNSGTIQKVIVLGAIAIMSLIGVQSYWIYQTYFIQEREFDQTVHNALYAVAKDLQKHYEFTLPNQKLVERSSTNYYVVNVNERFEAEVLEYYLRTQLEEHALRENFQYGVFDCSSDQMVTGKNFEYNKKTPITALSDELPKHIDDDFIYYFGVRFPNRTASILSNMWLVWLFTALMLITLAFFIYSMMVILRQKQLSEQQRDFINNMTHEFKTPISTINISTDVFLKNEAIQKDSRLFRYAGIIKEQAMRLNSQVENVLQIATVERGDLKLNFEEISLFNLIEQLTPSLEIKTAERGGTVHFQNFCGDCTILADRLHLTNIIHNLVDNGVKYCEKVPKIDISLRPEAKNNIRLSICDNGLGMEKEHQKRVFDKFYRIPKGNVHDVKGFGLGLFYVKNVCNEHHWKLTVESELGKGTCMHIHIPRT